MTLFMLPLFFYDGILGRKEEMLEFGEKWSIYLLSSCTLGVHSRMCELAPKHHLQKSSWI